MSRLPDLQKYHKVPRTKVNRRRNQKPTRLTDSSEKTSVQSKDETDMEKLAAVMVQLASSQQQFQQQLVNSEQKIPAITTRNATPESSTTKGVTTTTNGSTGTATTTTTGVTTANNGSATKQQKEFQKIMKEVGKQPTDRSERVNVAEYKEGEDIASFLEAFEGMMTQNEVEEEDWLKYLVPSLTSKARELSQYMEFDKCTYRDLKERIMKHFEVTSKAQRQKFREKKWMTESTPEAYVRGAEQLIQR